MLLIDVQMSVLTGLEAIRVIRDIEIKEKIEEKVPIIALTASTMNNEREKCINAGCNSCLTKPINKAELLKTMETYFFSHFKSKTTI